MGADAGFVGRRRRTTCGQRSQGLQNRVPMLLLTKMARGKGEEADVKS